MVLRRVGGCFLLISVVAVCNAQMPDGHEMMGVPALQDMTALSGMTAPAGLMMANADIADISTEALIAGPKVNGGFATPAPAINAVHHSNADCVGRMEGGRCVQFKNPTRLASTADNMASPEQDAAQKYEPDIHPFVQKHFGQRIMMETPEDTHHPSEGVTRAGTIGIMNGDGNEVPDKMAAALVPIGTKMMTAGDMEQDAFRHDANMNPDPDPPSIQEIMQTAQEAGVESSAIGYVTTMPVVETGDSEESIPVTVIAEPDIEMPPTPTPTPTQNLEELARLQAAAQAKVTQIENCMAFLGENQIQCSGATPAEATAMANDVANKEEVGTENPEPVNPVIEDPSKAKGSKLTTQDLMYDPMDLKGNFQALVLHCTGKAKAKFEDAEYATTELRIDMSAKLSRYASAMLCLDNNFPECIPDKAKEIIQHPPHIDSQGKTRDEWPCW